MKLPRRLEQILKKKQDFIDSSREKLNNSIIRLQSKWLDTIVTEVITELDVKDGVIQDTEKNYRLITQLDSVYKKFSADQNRILALQVTQAAAKIGTMSENYFSLTLGGRFDKVTEAARKATDLRFGLDGGQFVRGGLLEGLFSEWGTTEVKQIMSKAVSGQMDMKEFIRQMRGFVTGTAEKEGISERKFKQFAFDIYQQYDATYNAKLAEEFNMKYFVYQGDLVTDSRDFCAAHVGKVYTTKESEEWKTWTPARGQQERAYPADYEIKQKDIYAIPSYLGYPGYDPIIDRGGYNCRHHLAYISEELAFERRPELKIKS
ncbi:MAG TPA: hypothetical protein P5523_04955 [Bacteroidales bacterium]|nr:hypothetical protein [Bacteroidales bacterium]